MRLLLDTAAFIWLLDDDPALSGNAAALIADPSNTVMLSAVSAWEISIKHGLGRLELTMPLAEFVPAQRRLHRIGSLPITEEAAVQVWKLPDLHRDPFDRMLIAQAIVGGFTILTPDAAVRDYPVSTIW